MKKRDDLERLLLGESKRLQAYRRELEARVQEIQDELEDVVRRLSHVQALLAQESMEATDGNLLRSPAALIEEAIKPDQDPVEVAYAILQERGGEPMHYRELADAMRQRGLELPGSDPAQTLVARLVRDDRFVRPLRRGWYALRLHYPRGKSVGARRKRSPRKPTA